MIALLDIADPDAEAEPITWTEDLRTEDRAGLPDDSEAAGDEADCAWIEWTTMRGSQRAGHNQVAGDEDDETGGDDQDGHFAEDESCQAFAAINGPGCGVADPREDDTPCEDVGDDDAVQILDDVPMLPVLGAEHNIFTDRRVRLGILNLQSSFRTNGGEVWSAHTSVVHRSTCVDDQKPGVPV